MTFLLGYNVNIVISLGKLTFGDEGVGIKIWWWGESSGENFSRWGERANFLASGGISQ